MDLVEAGVFSFLDDADKVQRGTAAGGGFGQGAPVAEVARDELGAQTFKPEGGRARRIADQAA